MFWATLSNCVSDKAPHFDFDFFLSHSSQAKEVVRAMAERLTQ